MVYTEDNILDLADEIFDKGTTQKEMVSFAFDEYGEYQAAHPFSGNDLWQHVCLCGYGVVDIEFEDSVIVDGKTYYRKENIEGVIPFECFGCEQKQLFAIYKRDGEFKAVELKNRFLHYDTFSFAPFGSVHAQYDEGETYPTENGTIGRTKNVVANLYIEFAEFVGVELRRGNSMKFVERKNDDYVFRHCVFSYGYGNYLYVEYKAEDLINMDASSLNKDDVERLKNECEQIPIIKNSINPAVFSRPLTDAEKVECARFFLMNMALSRENKEMKQFKSKAI